MSRPKKISRREARIAAMHIIFAALNNEVTAAESIAGVCDVLEEERLTAATQDSLVEHIVGAFDLCRGEIEAQIVASYQRPFTQMTMLERAVLMVALAEVRSCPDTPPVVVINEAIEIAKAYGAEGGSTLVNGVLNDILAG
ncbi:MAG: transcription antitermination protein NusB [Proteobacteria bacterium]|nr:transcription antitermination protein NusB [Pseudomonadota bacterium]